MTEHKNLVGNKYNRFTVIDSTNETNYDGKLWLCKCECGTIKKIAARSLVGGRIKSCGCLLKEKAISTHTKHGDYKSRLYQIWEGMKRRCNNPKFKNYADYGGRGIRVCDEWNDFITFKKWATSNGYKDDLTLERKDVNGNYDPTNCKWATRTEQQRNRRSNFNITIDGVTKTLAEWCEITGIKRATVNWRRKRGWKQEDWFIKTSPLTRKQRSSEK